MILANDAWEFCTNGYPDPDAWVAYLKLVHSNAEVGMRHYGDITGRGYSKLIRDVKSELRTMGVADELG
jgi:hypothetical protein